MAEIYSKQALLFADGDVRSKAGDSLRRAGIEVGFGVSDAIDAMRRAFIDGVLASYLRGQIVSLSARKGFPYCFVVEAPMRNHLNADGDIDGLAVARDLVATLVALGLDQKFSESRANILIVSDDGEIVRSCTAAPESLMTALRVNNDGLKARIGFLESDRAAFSRNFLLKISTWNDFRKDPDLIIKGFVAQISARSNLEKKIPTLSAPAISTKNDAPARVVYPVSREKFWVDGEMKNVLPEWDVLRDDMISIVGSITTRNVRDVMSRIKALVVSGAGERKFIPEDPIVIYLGELCSIDATAATGFAQLLVTDLSKYKKKKVIANGVNEGILRRSHGYMLIKEFVRVDSY